MASMQANHGTAETEPNRSSNPPSKRTLETAKEAHRARVRASLNWALDAWSNTLEKLSK